MFDQANSYGNVFPDLAYKRVQVSDVHKLRLDVEL